MGSVVPVCTVSGCDVKKDSPTSVSQLQFPFCLSQVGVVGSDALRFKGSENVLFHEVKVGQLSLLDHLTPGTTTPLKIKVSSAWGRTLLCSLAVVLAFSLHSSVLHFVPTPWLLLSFHRSSAGQHQAVQDSTSQPPDIDFSHFRGSSEGVPILSSNVPFSLHHVLSENSLLMSGLLLHRLDVSLHSCLSCTVETLE